MFVFVLEFVSFSIIFGMAALVMIALRLLSA